MENDIIAKIMSEYDAERGKREYRARQQKNEVYKKYPRLEEIDNEIDAVGKNTLAEIFKTKDKASAMELMRSKYRVLRAEREAFMKKNGIPFDFDKPKYECELCGDTGYIKDKGRCSCFNKKLSKYRGASSNMSELIKVQNFENFNFEYFSKELPPGMKKSPYDNMKGIYKFCREFADDFENRTKGLIFSGDTGVGKTYMSSCIAKALMDKGYNVQYLRAAQLFRMFDDDRFGRLPDGMDEIYDCDFLIIDDLGTENDSKNNNSYILELINERIITNKKTLINTNLTLRGIEDRYSKRFSSRIISSFVGMRFYGEDIRRKIMSE